MTAPEPVLRLMPSLFANVVRAMADRAAGRHPPPQAHAPLLDDAALAALIRRIEAARPAPRRHREVRRRHTGDFRSAHLGRGLDFEETRPYQPGDDVRDMDWRTTARTGKPYLKTYRQERQALLHIVLDRGATMRFGTRERLKVTQAARIATMFVIGAMTGNTRIGGTLWQPGGYILPGRSGERGAMELVRAAITPCPPLENASRERQLGFADMLRQVDAYSPHDSTLVLISDFRQMTEADAPALLRLAARHRLVAVQVLDRVEQELPDVGLMRFQDAASGVTRLIDTSGKRVRERFRNGAAALHQAQESLVRRSGASFHRCRADEDPFPILTGVAIHGR